MSRKNRWIVTGVGAAVAIAAGATIGFATIPDSNGLISGCYSNSNGALRVIDGAEDSCRPNETAIRWNEEGPAGPPGISGVTRVSATKDLGDSNNGKYKSVSCPSGTVVLSGGYTFIGLPPAHITTDVNRPLPDSEGWEVFARNEYVENGSGWGIMVYAICANVGTAGT